MEGSHGTACRKYDKETCGKKIQTQLKRPLKSQASLSQQIQMTEITMMKKKNLSNSLKSPESVDTGSEGLKVNKDITRDMGISRKNI